MTTEATPSAQPRRPGFWRRHRVPLVLLVVVVVVLLGLVAWALYLNAKIAGINRFDVDLGEAGSRPAKVDSAAVNILLVGVDDGKGTELDEALDAEVWPQGAFRSDTIMVLHLDADRKHADLVSIPRDSYVAVPGHGQTKINAAFSYGGPALLTRTVEDLTGTYLDHVAVVDWTGFAGITGAVGGVEVVVPDTPASAEDGLEPGLQTLEGADALSYVRERKSLPGGDFDRVQRQQNVLRSVLSSTASAGVLANPIRLTTLVGELTDNLSVSDSLTSSEVRDLALSSRGLRTGDVTFATVPVLGTPTIDGASVVTVDRASIQQMFDAVQDDDLDTYLDEVDGAEVLPAQRDVD